MRYKISVLIESDKTEDLVMLDFEERLLGAAVDYEDAWIRDYWG